MNSTARVHDAFGVDAVPQDDLYDVMKDLILAIRDEVRAGESLR